MCCVLFFSWPLTFVASFSLRFEFWNNNATKDSCGEQDWNHTNKRKLCPVSVNPISFCLEEHLFSFSPQIPARKHTEAKPWKIAIFLLNWLKWVWLCQQNSCRSKSSFCLPVYILRLLCVALFSSLLKQFPSVWVGGAVLLQSSNSIFFILVQLRDKNGHLQMFWFCFKTCVCVDRGNSESIFLQRRKNLFMFNVNCCT